MKTLMVWLALGMALMAGDAWGAPKVGDMAPDFRLQASDGKTYSLAGFRGKQAVVIAWFPKAFTGGCTAECKSLRENGDQVGNTGAALFAASVDDAATNKKFAESLGLDYPILSDPTKETAKAFGVLNPANNLAQRWTFFIGKDGRILAIDQSVQPSSHGAAVAAKLKALGVGK